MNVLKTTILMAGLTPLLILGGGALGGEQGMVTALLFAGVMNFGMYWFSDKLVLRLYGAQEVTAAEAPDLHALVRDLARRAGLPMPKVYVIPQETPNAFATGRNPRHAAVAVTDGILRILDRDELAGVLAHELAHIRHRDILVSTVAATMAGAISMLANMAHWGMLVGSRRDDDEGGHPVAGFLMILVAPIAAMLIQMAISRSREFLADAGGAQIAGRARPLAGALRKLHQASQALPMEANPATAHLFIVSPLSGGGVLSLFSTHPPVEERIRRLEALGSR
jgi:heat shock protein HtpX